MRFRQQLIGALLMLMAGSLLIGSAHAATISGRVTDREGKPVRRVVVTIEPILLPANGEFRSTSSVTDADGQYTLDDLSPGAYVVSVRKEGWVETERNITVPTQSSAEPIDVPFEMELTMEYRAIRNFQFGSAFYLLLFGLAVLAFNFLLVPEPSPGVSLAAWAMIVIGVGLAWVKLDAEQALQLAVVGTTAGALVHRFGKRFAERRLQEEAKESQVKIEAIREDQKHIEEFIGKQGITLTDLRTCGNARIEGEVVPVRALRGYIPKDTRVVITKLDGRTPIVEELG